MKIKLINTLEFPTFYQSVKSAKLPIKAAYAVSVLCNEVEKQLAFYNEQLNLIINEFGQTDADGNFIPTEDGRGVKLIEGKEVECQARVQELQNLEIEINAAPLVLDDFGSIELSVEEIQAILPFVAE